MFIFDDHVVRHRSGHQPLQNKGSKTESEVAILVKENWQVAKRNVTL